MRFFDAHTHTQFAAFKDDYQEVIKRALANGVGLVNVGTQQDTSRRAVEIAHEFENEPVYAAIGLHPIHTSKSFHDVQELGGDKGFTGRGEEFDYDYYKKLALDPKVVAIGECGLDYAVFVRKQSERLQKRAPAEASESEGGFSQDEIEKTKNKQKETFLKQIELAKDVSKPLMIHCRNAFIDLIKVLAPNAYGLKPSIIHFFTGTTDDAKKLLDLGFYFTFGGVITFTSDYDEVIKMIPLDRILSETDAPYVTPVPYRGKRNEPAYVVEVVKKLAEIKEISAEKMSELILSNTKVVLQI